MSTCSTKGPYGRQELSQSCICCWWLSAKGPCHNMVMKTALTGSQYRALRQIAEAGTVYYLVGPDGFFIHLDDEARKLRHEHITVFMCAKYLEEADRDERSTTFILTPEGRGALETPLIGEPQDVNLPPLWLGGITRVDVPDEAPYFGAALRFTAEQLRTLLERIVLVADQHSEDEAFIRATYEVKAKVLDQATMDHYLKDKTIHRQMFAGSAEDLPAPLDEHETTTVDLGIDWNTVGVHITAYEYDTDFEIIELEIDQLFDVIADFHFQTIPEIDALMEEIRELWGL